MSELTSVGGTLLAKRFPPLRGNDRRISVVVRMASSLAHAGRAAKRGSAPRPTAGSCSFPAPVTHMLLNGFRMTVITLCSGPVFAIAAAEPSAGSKAQRGGRRAELSAMRARKHKTVRNPLMTVMGTVEWSPNVRHENLKCGVCRTASLPPSLTGFSCHNAGDPRIGIV